jgi:hypothetical protein
MDKYKFIVSGPEDCPKPTTFWLARRGHRVVTVVSFDERYTVPLDVLKEVQESVFPGVPEKKIFLYRAGVGVGMARTA